MDFRVSLSAIIKSKELNSVFAEKPLNNFSCFCPNYDFNLYCIIRREGIIMKKTIQSYPIIRKKVILGVIIINFRDYIILG